MASWRQTRRPGGCGRAPVRRGGPGAPGSGDRWARGLPGAPGARCCWRLDFGLPAKPRDNDSVLFQAAPSVALGCSSCGKQTRLAEKEEAGEPRVAVGVPSDLVATRAHIRLSRNAA